MSKEGGVYEVTDSGWCDRNLINNNLTIWENKHYICYKISKALLKKFLLKRNLSDNLHEIEIK